MHDEKKAKWVVSQNGIRELVRKYLVEPCKRYVLHFGPDVFVPAAYDMRVLEKEDRYADKTPKVVEFLRGWIYYRLCDLLIKRDKGPLVRDIGKLVDKLPAPKGEQLLVE